MQLINTRPIKEMGKNFIPPEFLPKGKDDYYLREQQRDKTIKHRPLKADEVEILVKNKNKAEDWNTIFVTQQFDPERVRNCTFHGLIRIGDLEPVFLEHKDLRMAVGLYDSLIISCEIGSNVVIRNVSYLANYIIGNNVILINIDEMLTTNHAKFGNGILKEGEDESLLLPMELGNENGKRQVRPFNGMLSSDCYLWYKYRDDKKMLQKLEKFTTDQFSSHRGYYGTIKDRTIIKNCRVIKDVKTGTDAYIKGANKLKNLTVNSSSEAHTQIGEGVELVNGIIGYGSRIFYGVKAVRFVIADHSELKYGARLINSYLGENSTISCCEVLNSLIFPCHEQHHNNSFLCAATIKGQSNMAAGATVGSNHNSRGADGEIVAGRGFWPGLCTNFKHFSNFASFCLIAKGTYHSELNIQLPFALVSNNEAENCLQIMPAYWFLYNMYAMARNPDKYRSRDKRIKKNLLLEFDYLAPDTIEEIFSSLNLLEKWTANSFRKLDLDNQRALISTCEERDPLHQFDLNSIGNSDEEILALGKALLSNKIITSKFEILGENQEAARRPCCILKASEGYHAYIEMTQFFISTQMLAWVDSEGIDSLKQLITSSKKEDRTSWINMGGQLIPEFEVISIRQAIRNGEIDSWDEVHQAWRNSAALNQKNKIKYALGVMKELNLSVSEVLLEGSRMGKEISNRTRDSREKDYTNPFRMITFDNKEERDAVLGCLEDNSFIHVIKEQSLLIDEKINQLLPQLKS